jgi:hypothetical protein
MKVILNPTILYSDVSDASFTVRFFAPKKGNLVLRLHHCGFLNGGILRLKEIISFQHEFPAKYTVEHITLSATIHFSLDTATILTFVPSTTHYKLYDIQLLDESLNPYDAAILAPSHFLPEMEMRAVMCILVYRRN